MSKQLISLLNKEVANLGVMYVKLHNYHWLVKGKNFFQLHAKFEELYDEVTEHFDAVAERVLALGGTPVATLKQFLEVATIKEATGQETNEEMIRSIISDFELLDKELSEGLTLSDEINDDVTADLITGIKASLQKHVWMFTAYLK